VTLGIWLFGWNANRATNTEAVQVMSVTSVGLGGVVPFCALWPHKTYLPSERGRGYLGWRLNLKSEGRWHHRHHGTGPLAHEPSLQGVAEIPRHYSVHREFVLDVLPASINGKSSTYCVAIETRPRRRGEELPTSEKYFRERGKQDAAACWVLASFDPRRQALGCPLETKAESTRLLKQSSVVSSSRDVEAGDDGARLIFI